MDASMVPWTFSCTLFHFSLLNEIAYTLLASVLVLEGRASSAWRMTRAGTIGALQLAAGDAPAPARRSVGALKEANE